MNKLPQKQKELISILADLEGLPKLTDSQQLVLANVVKWYGTEFARANGYIYCTNESMLKDTGISLSSLKSAIRRLTITELIRTERGNITKDGKTASKYWLNEKILKQIAPYPKGTNYPLNYPLVCPLDKNENCPLICPLDGKEIENQNISFLFGEILQQIKGLREDIDLLKTKISTLNANLEENENCPLICPLDVQKANCPQDIEIDKEKEILVNTIEGTHNMNISMNENKGITGDGCKLVDTSNGKEQETGNTSTNEQETNKLQTPNQQGTGNDTFKWFGQRMKRGYDLLHCLEVSKTEDGAKAYTEEINALILNVRKAIDQLTEKQSDAFMCFLDRFIKASDNKKRYFNGGQTKTAQTQTNRKQIEKTAPMIVDTLTDVKIKKMAIELEEDLWETGNFQRYTNQDEKNTKTIKARGTSELLQLYEDTKKRKEKELNKE